MSVSREHVTVRKRREETGRDVESLSLFPGSNGDLVSVGVQPKGFNLWQGGWREEGETKSTQGGVPFGRQGQPSSEDKAAKLAVSLFCPPLVSC